MRRIVEFVGYCIRGLLMGVADSVPGISGGSVAFVTGIYEKLVDNLNIVGIYLFRRVWRGDLLFLFREADMVFLVGLVMGIVGGLVTMSHLLGYLLSEYRLVIWSVFGGFVAGGFFVFWGEGAKGVRGLVFVGMGLVVGFFISSAHRVLAWSHGPVEMFVSATVAICAMILPGISGATILVLLNQYEYALGLLRRVTSSPLEMGAEEWLSLLMFVAGMVVGLFSFVRLLRWLLARARKVVISFLNGLMVGTLPVFVPWETINSAVDGLVAVVTAGVGALVAVIFHRMAPP